MNGLIPLPGYQTTPADFSKVEDLEKEREVSFGALHVLLPSVVHITAPVVPDLLGETGKMHADNQEVAGEAERVWPSGFRSTVSESRMHRTL